MENIICWFQSMYVHSLLFSNQKIFNIKTQVKRPRQCLIANGKGLSSVENNILWIMWNNWAMFIHNYLVINKYLTKIVEHSEIIVLCFTQPNITKLTMYFRAFYSVTVLLRSKVSLSSPLLIICLDYYEQKLIMQICIYHVDATYTEFS
jgi:hypothetical protein